MTHLLTTQKRTHVAGYGEFLVEILGFILGIRLTTEGTGHLWPTPLRQGQLVGFIPKRSEMLFCLERATSFWETHFEVRRLMFGAVHWFLVSHSYQNQYERFSWMYTVLDTLHRIAWHVSDRYRRRLPDRKGSHGERPKALSETFGSPLPETFGDPNKQVGNVAALLKARNELVHEARWTDEPLGHAVSEEGQRMIYEMTHFCSQIILGLMNVPCGFRTAAYSRSGHGLDVEM